MRHIEHKDRYPCPLSVSVKKILTVTVHGHERRYFGGFMEGLAKEADRWFRQAENDLKAAQGSQQGGFHAQTCFWAQQSAAKALRAFLFINKEDAKETRSVSELLERCLTYDEEFKSVIEHSSRLDIYYKTTRYPDSLPGGIPAELISNRDSNEAIKIAADILALVEEKRKAYVPERM